ncbi:hypothetical protein K505DRAFT_370966 [Melanomma pulvis-pyrius CBS 109.77]|uniref:Jacalin-type lectin domain-containing protein n=1 Tax=Melanomma pulvis-pyrius CBS 109.77 TaxID=1314802 RepID=A0A6A6XSP9_9PLEO|nr:hypothetical protein K505DRAFT_370966 [Melanomma pulvis-pyrius CBS 109.77]
MSAIGLVIPSTEKAMFLENLDWLEGLEVAVTVSGIVGLRILVQSPNGQYSHTAGDFDTTTPDVGIRKLLPYNGRRLFAITVGLDACKFISMQLIESDLTEATTGPSHTTTARSADKLQCKHNSTVIADRIYASTFPSHDTSITSVPTTPTNQIVNVHLNMDFGGPGGCLLGSLRRIVAIMFGYPKIFLGLDFIYNDGRHSFYGRRSIYTNKGNHTTFGVYGDTYMNLSKSRSMLKPPEEKVITGFLAVLGVFDGSFQTFGIQSQMLWRREPQTTQQCSSIVSHALSVTPESPDTGSHIIHGRGTAYTAASLSGVRRIRISSGATGRSRTSQHISGLWLEYYDSDGPVIVGQWITELDSWELAPSEKITEILMWSSNELTNSQEGQAKLGRIMGFSFATSNGNSKQILQEDTDGQVWIKFRANRFEELGSIIWAFNSTWYHARVLYSPTPTKDGLDFIFLPHESPSWVVPEKLLWQDCDLNGNCSTVASIQVSFVIGAICGISFTYTSGITRTLGSQEGDTSTMHLDSDEELTRMDIGFHYINRIRFVSFYTNHGRQMTRGVQLPVKPVQQFVEPGRTWDVPLRLKPFIQPQVALRTSNSDWVFGLHPFSNVCIIYRY